MYCILLALAHSILVQGSLTGGVLRVALLALERRTDHADRGAKESQHQPHYQHRDRALVC